MIGIGSAFFFIAHLLIGMFLKQVVGLDITASPAGLTTWDSYWQTLPAADLRSDLFQSLWYLHSQPPLHNLYGAIFLNLFPDSALPSMHIANIVLGALIAAMSYCILKLATRSTWIALIGGAVIALNPALFLFEAYPLYTIPSLFFITLSVFFIARYQTSCQPHDLFGFILAVNLLVLTRSMYHPLFLIPCLALVVLLARAQRRRVLRIALLISLLGFGWATKNYLQYGFWGTSSWGGLNLWRIVSDGYPSYRLEDFARTGVIDPLVVAKGPFTYPGSYLSDGFDAVSSIDSLARDDYNNINIPAISKVYQQSALALIAYDPGHYLTRVARAYNIYTCPATGFKHHAINGPKI